MHRYAILCTADQTKTALELGAPIEFIKIGEGKPLHYICSIENKGYYKIPTAEEMVGWLEEQCIMFNIATNPFDEYKVIISKAGGYNNIANIKWNKSRKQATLAAIDAALEYLENIKQ